MLFVKFDTLISNMSFKCPLCMRIFSQRFAYTQHTQKCLKNVEVEVKDDDDDDDSEKYSSEMDTKSNQSSEYENDKVEVIMYSRLFFLRLLRKAQIY